jgi:hypothetical protein
MEKKEMIFFIIITLIMTNDRINRQPHSQHTTSQSTHQFQTTIKLLAGGSCRNSHGCVAGRKLAVPFQPLKPDSIVIITCEDAKHLTDSSILSVGFVMVGSVLKKHPQSVLCLEMRMIVRICSECIIR